MLEIYAKENGRGIAFAIEEEDEPPPASRNSPDADSNARNKPSLKLVK